MTKEEAKKALLEGKKVRHKSWEPEYFVYFDFKDMRLKIEDGTGFFIFEDETALLDNGWEIYETPKEDIKVYVHLYEERVNESKWQDGFVIDRNKEFSHALDSDYKHIKTIELKE